MFRKLNACGTNPYPQPTIPLIDYLAISLPLSSLVPGEANSARKGGEENNSTMPADRQQDTSTLPHYLYPATMPYPIER